MNPILTNIHNDITYLSFLDYVDIKSLCNSSKQLSYIIKDNEILRSILYNKNKNIEITPNFDISSALKDIYGSIQKIIDANYPRKSLPRWTNKQLFNDDMLRKLMDDFIERVTHEISGIYSPFHTSYQEIIEVELYSSTVAAVLFSDIKYDGYEDDNIPHTVIIPKSFWDYVIPSINNVEKLFECIERIDKDGKPYEYREFGYQLMFKILSDLLFVY